MYKNCCFLFTDEVRTGHLKKMVIATAKIGLI